MTNPIIEYGFTAVPASATALLTDTPAYPRLHAQPDPIPITDTPIPTTALAQRINAYARTHLPEPTYNHCLRVYHFGLAIKKHRFPFSDWAFSDETYFLACVLHDIGTSEENLHATHLSFEFFGGFLALQVLQSESDGGSAPREQAESVAEAIIRHQDLCTVGMISAVGQLLQLATIFGTYYNIIISYLLRASEVQVQVQAQVNPCPCHQIYGSPLDPARCSTRSLACSWMFLDGLGRGSTATMLDFFFIAQISQFPDIFILGPLIGAFGYLHRTSKPTRTTRY